MRCDRQIGIAQHCLRDGQRVDGIRLTAGTGTRPRLGHQLRRHPHHRLACREQITLQTRRQIAAVFDPPPQVITELFTRPRQCFTVPGGGGRHHFLAEFAAHFVDRDEGVGALVYIGANNDH
jgi:hypothetical protein